MAEVRGFYHCPVHWEVTYCQACSEVGLPQMPALEDAPENLLQFERWYDTIQIKVLTGPQVRRLTTMESHLDKGIHKREITKYAALECKAVKYITKQDGNKQSGPSETDHRALNSNEADRTEAWRDLQRCTEKQFDFLVGSFGDEVGRLTESRPKLCIDEFIRLALIEQHGHSYMWRKAEDDADEPMALNRGMVING